MKSLSSEGKKMYEFPAEIVDMMVRNNIWVVKCADGITYLVSEKALEEFQRKQKELS